MKENKIHRKKIATMEIFLPYVRITKGLILPECDPGTILNFIDTFSA